MFIFKIYLAYMKFATIASFALASFAGASASDIDASPGADSTNAQRAENDSVPATTGFYLDMGSSSKSGIHYLKAKVGDQWLKLGINTSSPNFSIVENQCKLNNCKVSNSFDSSKSVLIQPRTASLEENSVISTADNRLIKPKLQNSAIYQDDISL